MELTLVDTRPAVVKLFSCSTQLSMKFQLLLITKMLPIMFLTLELSDVIIMLFMLNIIILRASWKISNMY